MNERMEKIIHHPATVPVTTGVLSFGLGITLGYILGKRQNREGVLYELPQPMSLDLTEEDLDEMREPEIKVGQPEVKMPDPVVIEEEAYEAVLEDYGAPEVTEVGREFIERILVSDEDEPEDEEGPKDQNVFTEFASPGPDWDWDAELELRKAPGPYVLHQDEFHANELGFSQSTLTYYAGDDVMVDPEDKPITRHSTIFGELLFGHGSGDPNVVFIRNPKLRGEYEIYRHPGKYANEVLHIQHSDDEEARDLKHSHRPGRFRSD